MSATVPAPVARVAEPRKPARKRQTMREAKVREAPAPAVNTRREVKVPIYTGRRPNVSDMGAITNGPNARPSVKTVRVRIDTVRETLKCASMRPVAGTDVVVENVLNDVSSV